MSFKTRIPELYIYTKACSKLKRKEYVIWRSVQNGWNKELKNRNKRRKINFMDLVKFCIAALHHSMVSCGILHLLHKTYFYIYIRSVGEPGDIFLQHLNRQLFIVTSQWHHPWEWLWPWQPEGHWQLRRPFYLTSSYKSLDRGKNVSK